MKTALELNTPTFEIIETPIRSIVANFENKIDPNHAPVHVKLQNIAYLSPIEVQAQVNAMSMYLLRKRNEVAHSGAVAVRKHKLRKHISG